MPEEIIKEIDRIIQELTRLRIEFSDGIANGKSFGEVKAIHAQMKAMLKLLQQYEASGGDREAAAN